MNNWHFEQEAAKQGYTHVAGIDEAGRGPLAGPVVAAAVILPRDFPVEDVTDSKKLTPKKRERLYTHIFAHADDVGVGVVESEEIDRVNILNASLSAMALSVKDLGTAPDFLLIDGNFTIPLELPQQALPKGDALSVSIAAASIVAKVTRDRLMGEYHEIYPQFGFANNKGYPTREHRNAIKKHGISPIHRLSFSGVREHRVQMPLFKET